ncbi:MAG: PilZ domain-containing protein [Planctomycetia bacterium]|nr:PilZ domain-containing protein [Planctomycetia bacterium]
MKSCQPRIACNQSAVRIPEQVHASENNGTAPAGACRPAAADVPDSAAAGSAGQASSSKLLLSSLQRLYDAPGQIPLDQQSTRATLAAPIGDPEYDLSASLLEAVFEISDFDPLPQLCRTEVDSLESYIVNRSRADLPASSRGTPALHPQNRSEAPRVIRPAPSAGLASDRRKLPRRESECLVAVCPCTTDERLTAERIAWRLHSTQRKGTLLDVSMSGISFCLPEPLPADSRILLRITNRTIDEHVDTTATVLRSREAVNGGWTIVCRFNKNLSFEQIHVVGRSLFAATIV